MDFLKFSFVLLLSVEFLCLVSGNSISGLFGKGDDKVAADDKTSSSTKSETGVTSDSGPSFSCGGLKGFLHICDKTETAEPRKSVKTRSVPEESDSDSDSDESDSDERKSSEVKITTASSQINESTNGGIAKRQADDLDVSETSGTTDSDDTPAVPAPEELPSGWKKREVNESDSNSESESVEEKPNRKRRDCRDGPEDKWKDC